MADKTFEVVRDERQDSKKKFMELVDSLTLGEIHRKALMEAFNKHDEIAIELGKLANRKTEQLNGWGGRRSSNPF
jgi:hypothetical protein